jgi:ubiquitin C-terminal hydrolase
LELIKLFYGKVIILREKNKRNRAIVVQAYKFIIGQRMCILAQNHYYKYRDKLKNNQIENEMADENSNESSNRNEKSNEKSNEMVAENSNESSNRNEKSNEMVDEVENEKSNENSNEVEYESSNESSFDSFLANVPDNYVCGSNESSNEDVNVNPKIRIEKTKKIVQSLNSSKSNNQINSNSISPLIDLPIEENKDNSKSKLTTEIKRFSEEKLGKAIGEEISFIFENSKKMEHFSELEELRKNIILSFENISSVQPTIGLSNPNNRCYINSVITALTQIPLILDYFEQNNHDPIIAEIINIVSQWNSNATSIKTDKLVYLLKKDIVPKFDGNSQQDAIEFLEQLLEYFHNKTSPISEGNSFVNMLFDTMEASTTTCPKGHSSTSLNKIKVLHVEVKDETTLLDCLKSHFGNEKLESPKDCIGCASHSPDCHKEIKLKHLPPVLIISMKLVNKINTKIEQQIEFPETLDLSEFCSNNNNNSKYNLCAAITQTGTAEKGHFIPHFRDGKFWKSMDDGSPPKKSNQFYGKNVYCLIYVAESLFEKNIKI